MEQNIQKKNRWKGKEGRGTEAYKRHQKGQFPETKSHFPTLKMKAACSTNIFISTELYSFALQKKVVLFKFSLYMFLCNKLVLKWK
jgi:hypothetical protein